ncbi:MAG TPA: hypothetical protein VKG84_04590 [Candidatus Acidoferrales bacterium]|nr:hypothetical protein [Candidatus Acidoferrales bacterium]
MASYPSLCAPLTRISRDVAPLAPKGSVLGGLSLAARWLAPEHSPERPPEHLPERPVEGLWPAPLLVESFIACLTIPFSL